MASQGSGALELRHRHILAKKGTQQWILIQARCSGARHSSELTRYPVYWQLYAWATQLAQRHAYTTDDWTPDNSGIKDERSYGISISINCHSLAQLSLLSQDRTSLRDDPQPLD